MIQKDVDSLDPFANQIAAARRGMLDPRELIADLGQCIFLVATNPVPGSADRAAIPLWVFAWGERPHAALFTSAEQMVKFGEIPAYVEIAGSQLRDFWPAGLTAAINPAGGDAAMIMPAEDVVRIGDQPTPDLGAGSTAYIGRPRKEPSDRQKAAVAAALSGSEAATAYLFQISDQTGASSLVAGIVFRESAEHDHASAVPTIAGHYASRPESAQEPPLRFLVLEGPMLEQVASWSTPVIPADRRQEDSRPEES